MVVAAVNHPVETDVNHSVNEGGVKVETIVAEVIDDVAPGGLSSCFWRTALLCG